MANQEPSKLVLRRMTESQIKTFGGNKFVYAKRWTWIAAFAFGVGFFLIMSHFYKHTTATNIISIVPLVVLIVAFFYTLNKAGKKFWDEVKDKEEPLEIK
jgi:cell division protein FtsW (lipid II flippase)